MTYFPLQDYSEKNAKTFLIYVVRLNRRPIFPCKIILTKVINLFWFMWSGSTTELLKVRSIEKVWLFIVFVQQVTSNLIITYNQVKGGTIRYSFAITFTPTISQLHLHLQLGTNRYNFAITFILPIKYKQLQFRNYNCN